LEGVGSDTENGLYVGDKCIEVYIQSKNSKNETVFNRWNLVDDELFMNTKDTEQNIGNIYDGESEVFNLRLNENKTYEIKFGNGIIGKKLNKGDSIYVFYLLTNGEDGKLDTNDIDSSAKALEYGAQYLNITEDTYKKMLSSKRELVYRDDIMVFQNLPTTDSTEEEDADDIRNNAPIWFKLGRRLITAEDYKYFLKNMAGNSSVIDCEVQNNWEYAGTFYKWLYNLGLQNHNNQRYYLNETKLVKGGYQYSDAADSNNIYIWIKLQGDGSIDVFQDLIQKSLQKMKTLTSEIIFLEPITVYFGVSALPEDKAKENIKNYGELDPSDESYIEVELDNNSIYVTSEIQQRVNDTINDFFDERKMSIGCTMNYQDLMTSLYEINGIKRIRTVYQKKNSSGDNDTDTPPIIKEGISFITWSKGGMIEEGDDLDSSNIMKSLQPFQFPQLYTTELKSSIKVIKKSINNVNKITY